jgi:LysM repeat protein
MRAGRAAGGLIAVALWLGAPAAASASLPHVVQPGESLWSISYANNLTLRTVAVFNGLDENTVLTVGQTIQVPTVAEGAAALANAGITPGSSTTTSTTSSTGGGTAHVIQPGESLWSIADANGITVSALASFNGLAEDAMLITGETIQVPMATSSTTSSGIALGDIPSPYGTLHLRTDAADSWNSMRQESVNDYGVDLYPGGPMSAYRTYDQQSYLYNLYLSGQGSPANPPGTSTHELGVAVDVATQQMRDVVDQIGSIYGWAGTVPTEWWHVQYLGG